MKNIDDQLLKLQIWDTAGQERYRAITHVYYRGANGAILFYDVTSRKTFDGKMQEWVNEVRAKASQGVPIVVVGNKIDLEDKREVSTDEGRQFAESMGLPFLEISAKEGIRVHEAFAELCRSMLGTGSKNLKNSTTEAGENQSVELLTERAEKPKKKKFSFGCVV